MDAMDRWVQNVSYWNQARPENYLFTLYLVSYQRSATLPQTIHLNIGWHYKEKLLQLLKEMIPAEFQSSKEKKNHTQLSASGIRFVFLTTFFNQMSIVNLINTCVYIFFALATRKFVVNVGNNILAEENHTIYKCPWQIYSRTLSFSFTDLLHIHQHFCFKNCSYLIP